MPNPAAAERVLVVIPAYREERNIGAVVRAVRELFPYDILVVNDGSPDGTGKAARRACSRAFRPLLLISASHASATSSRPAFRRRKARGEEERIPSSLPLRAASRLRMGSILWSLPACTPSINISARVL